MGNQASRLHYSCVLSHVKDLNVVGRLPCAVTCMGKLSNKRREGWTQLCMCCISQKKKKKVNVKSV